MNRFQQLRQRFSGLSKPQKFVSARNSLLYPATAETIHRIAEREPIQHRPPAVPNSQSVRGRAGHSPQSQAPAAASPPGPDDPRVHHMSDSMPVPKPMPRPEPKPSSSPHANSSPSSPSSVQPLPAVAPHSGAKAGQTSHLCSFRFSDGRRCRMLRSKDHPDLCAHHSRMELRALEQTTDQPLAKEILGKTRDLHSGTAINNVLGNLFVLAADGRISARRAATLAYLGQLLVQTLPALKREQFDLHPDPRLLNALKATLLTPTPKTEAAKFAQQVFRRVLGEEESEESNRSSSN